MKRRLESANSVTVELRDDRVFTWAWSDSLDAELQKEEPAQKRKGRMLERMNTVRKSREGEACYGAHVNMKALRKQTSGGGEGVFGISPRSL